MLLSILNVKFIIKMHLFTMFITAACVLFLIKLRWPKNKSLLISYTHRKQKKVSEDSKNKSFSFYLL